MGDINGLLEVLGNMRRGYAALNELAKSEQEALVAGDSAKVKEITEEETRALETIERLETARREITARFVQRCGKEEPALSDIINISQGREKQELIKAKEELEGATVALLSQNDLNRQLLDLHFEYIDFIINMYTSRDQANNLYGDNGAQKDAPAVSLGLLDREV